MNAHRGPQRNTIFPIRWSPDQRIQWMIGVICCTARSLVRFKICLLIIRISNAEYRIWNPCKLNFFVLFFIIMKCRKHRALHCTKMKCSTEVHRERRSPIRWSPDQRILWMVRALFLSANLFHQECFNNLRKMALLKIMDLMGNIIAGVFRT
jgi:hypothetical protein